VSEKKYEVYWDLYDSPFVADFSGFHFCFSTEFNRKRFSEKVAGIPEMNKKVSVRYGVELDLTVPIAFGIYKDVERRGFLVYGGNEFFGGLTSCEQVKFDGVPRKK